MPVRAARFSMERRPPFGRGRGVDVVVRSHARDRPEEDSDPCNTNARPPSRHRSVGRSKCLAATQWSVAKRAISLSDHAIRSGDRFPKVGHPSAGHFRLSIDSENASLVFIGVPFRESVASTPHCDVTRSAGGLRRLKTACPDREGRRGIIRCSKTITCDGIVLADQPSHRCMPDQVGRVAVDIERHGGRQA